MNWKKVLKILAISFSSVVIVLGAFGIWALSKLPGPSQLNEAVRAVDANLEQTAKSHSAKVEPAVPEQSASGDRAKSKDEAMQDSAEQKKVDVRAAVEFLADPNQPMSDACRDLGRAGESGFFPKKTDRSAVKFFEVLVKPQKDPVIESVAPLLRFVFRAPGVSEILKMTENSTGEDSLADKAALYAEILRTANYLRTNGTEMNNVLQKSYNIHMLSKAVALKPELASQSSTVNFCEQIERSLVDRQDLNVEEQVQEMEKFLQDSGIDPKSIGFDPKYRARVQTEFDKNSLTIKDAWLKELFSKGLM
ncbi:hypothetical protein [Bdellovibrio sp. HCB274]|uniref:hypothetical protein n=1 Tax=Bdellovibrio sp. HCB274 TaxID=3394361 RepID=UPI0039B45C5B